MHCIQCGQFNSGGNFCVKCGTRLQVDSFEQQAVAVSEAGQQPTYSKPATQNPHVEKAKTASKLYLSYFLQGMKTPTTLAQSVYGDQFVNGLITMIIYALSIPLMMYFGVRDFVDDFTEMVIQPAFFYLLFIGFVALITFAVVRMGRVQVSLKDVCARFGTFLIVPTSFLLMALILSLIQIELFILLLLFGFLGLFLVVPFTIYSFKKDVPNGLDGIYGTFLAYLAIIILLVTIGAIMINLIIGVIGSMFDLGFGFF